MTILDAVLAARAHTLGVAQRRSAYRHLHLVDGPIALVPWHLGAEPFTFAALAYGTDRDRYEGLSVPGEPRDRRLLFPCAVQVANWFNDLFETPWRGADGDASSLEIAPQVLVPNVGAITVLKKLGRRLAYLPTEPRDGYPGADPALLRFGRHLVFLGLWAGEPGQQIVVSATALASSGWITEQTTSERGNLAALDAWIEPPPGVHGFAAAERSEDVNVGPLPAPAVERKVDVVIQAFNDARRADTPKEANAALDELTRIYADLSEPAWQVMWRVFDRERQWTEEPRFVPRRWRADIDEYARHMEWMDGPAEGRRRTRQTIRQAMIMRRNLEAETARVEAEDAISDPLLLIPYLLDQKAFEGEVVDYDDEHKELKPGRQRLTRAPLVTIRTSIPCLMPRGKELWWTEHPEMDGAQVDSITDDPDGPGGLVTVKFVKNLKIAEELMVTSGPVCFSELNTSVFLWDKFPPGDPWTHVGGAANPESIEGDT